MGSSIHRVLALVELEHLVGSGRVLRSLVLSLAKVAREAELRSIGGANLPHYLWSEPHVRVNAVARHHVGRVSIRLVLLRRPLQGLRIGVAEARSQFANALKLLRVHVIACERIHTVQARSLALSIEATDADEIQAVRHAAAVEIVLLQFQPRECPLRWCVRGVLSIEPLHHQSLGLRGHRFIQERLQAAAVPILLVVATLRKIEASGDLANTLP
eukprot:scaffold371_cov273-Pinguiococcus_pyrenoidosus.AAC.2